MTKRYHDLDKRIFMARLKDFSSKREILSLSLSLSWPNYLLVAHTVRIDRVTRPKQTLFPTARTKPLLRKSNWNFMVGSCRQPLTTFSFHIPFYRSFSLSFSRENARGTCVHVRGASLGVVRIDEGLLIIVPSLRQDESCICIPAPLSLFLSVFARLCRVSWFALAICLRRTPFLSFSSPFYDRGWLPQLFVYFRTNRKTVRSLRCLGIEKGYVLYL